MVTAEAVFPPVLNVFLFSVTVTVTPLAATALPAVSSTCTVKFGSADARSARPSAA